MVTPVTEGVFDSVVALFGGNRLQFGLADHVTGRIHVRIRRLEVLVDKNSPVVVRLHPTVSRPISSLLGWTPVATNSASPVTVRSLPSTSVSMPTSDCIASAPPSTAGARTRWKSFPVITLIPSSSKARCISRPSWPSIPERTRSERCRMVTSTPMRWRIWPHSRAMYPPPMITMLPGRLRS